MQRSFPLFPALILLLVTLGSIAHAAERWVLPINEASWRTLNLPGVPANQFTANDHTLHVRSDASVSFRYFELPKSQASPVLISWHWRVDTHSVVAPQTVIGRDDRPLAVHIWFDDTTGRSVFGGLGTLFGYPKVGHLLTYVWGAEEEAGSVLPNPHYDRGKIIVLVGDDGQTGQWRAIRRDISKDYLRAFGKPPDLSELRYVAISADSDDLHGYSTAAVRSLSFHVP